MLDVHTIAFYVLLVGCLPGIIHCDCTIPGSGRPTLKCNIISDSDICKKQPDDVYLPDTPGMYPNAPRDLTIEPYIRNKFPVMNISFYGPDDASLKTVKGFEITLVALDGLGEGSRICRLLNLSAAMITNDDVLTPPRFTYSGLRKLRIKTTFWVRVVSLPKPNVSPTGAPYVKMVSKYVTTPRHQVQPVPSPENSAAWTTFIEYQFDKRVVTINFKLAPESFKFRDYKVSLFNKETNKVDVSVVVTRPETIAKLDWKCAGRYSVWVQPVDNYAGIRKRCLCKQQGKGCEHCTISSSAELNITRSNPTCKDKGVNDPDPPTGGPMPQAKPVIKDPRQGPDNGGTGVNIVLVSCVPVALVVVILVIVLFALWRWRWRGIDDDHCPPWAKHPLINQDSPASTPTSQVPSTPTPLMFGVEEEQPATVPPNNAPKTLKKLLILYYPDCEDHRYAVFHLSNFLQNHCFMDVCIHDRCETRINQLGKSKWLLEMFSQVDWIVILNSEGAFKNYSGELCRDTDISDGMFKNAMDMLDKHSDVYGKKCISVYFQYSPKDCLIRQFTPNGIQYELMTNMEPFYRHVHRKNKCDQDSENFVLIANNLQYHLTDDGKLLKDIIDKLSPTLFTEADHDLEDVVPYCYSAEDPDHHNGGESGFESMPLGEDKLLNYPPRNLEVSDGDSTSTHSADSGDSAHSASTVGSDVVDIIKKFHKSHNKDSPFYAKPDTGISAYQHMANEVPVEVLVHGHGEGEEYSI